MRDVRDPKFFNRELSWEPQSWFWVAAASYGCIFGFCCLGWNIAQVRNSVKTLVSNGKKTDAIDLLQANNEAVKEQLNEGFQSIDVAATLDVIALGFMAAGEDKLAASVLKRLNYVC